ncbi:hypothetical protein SAMN04489834_2974 [Microterricola viridarii]|uniref:Uncharacterized protein n=1 Tax=Microterricola viridarii TaxID=412690 RepID=A0A1H1Y483_9MICO|nr:hypothetical protein SAMN04489834_2974 [Microterricola viridarii]
MLEIAVFVDLGACILALDAEHLSRNEFNVEVVLCIQIEPLNMGDRGMLRKKGFEVMLGYAAADSDRKPASSPDDV